MPNEKILKWAGIVLGFLFVLIGVVYGYMHYRTSSRFNREYQVQVQAIAIPNACSSDNTSPLLKAAAIATVRIRVVR